MTNSYEAPAMKTIFFFAELSYMMLSGSSSTVGTEPGGVVPDYEMETP